MRALVLVDVRPLQKAAWRELHEARKRLDKASRDLHRHENVDLPAYETWIHRTFPVYVTTLRELHQEVFTKGRQVEAVQAMAELTGRSLKRLWREQKEYEADPAAFEARFRADHDDSPRDRREPGEPRDDFFEEEDSKHGWSGQHSHYDGFNPMSESAPPNRSSQAAKDIYRRLVQRLHPDRGGEWTDVRKRVWHEVQQAWSAGDTDWLARLEVEWETATDVLKHDSPLSRLRRALDEVARARRDLDRKLRDYRRAVQWRFTLSEKKRAQLQRRTEENFKHDIDFLQRQLAYLNATIAAWETAKPRRRNDFANLRRAY